MGRGHLPSPGNVEKCFFLCYKNSSIRHCVWRPDPLGELTAVPRPLAGSRERSPKERGGVRKGDKGKGQGRGNMYEYI